MDIKSMLMKPIYTVFILLSTACVMNSCDPQNTYRKSIYNQTDKDLLVTEYLNKEILNTYTVDNNSESLIYNFSRTGGPTGTCKFLLGDSLGVQVKNNTSLIVTKNLNIEDSWVRNSSGSSAKGYLTECKAVIKNTDVILK